MPRRDLTPTAWAALLAIYVIWGSTYLAIKYVVETMPPLLTAGVRFLTAGVVMYAVGRRREGGTDRPTAAHWRAAAIIGTALCLGGNGLVNLAEKRPLASGTAALLIATVPLWLALFDRIIYKTRLDPVVVGGLLLGFAGAGLLVNGEGAGFDTLGAVLAIVASIIWAAGSLYARNAELPSRPAVSTGMEMIAGGGALLVAGAVAGELGGIETARFSAESLWALAYLIVFGSIVGFSAYVWLLRNVRTTIVGTYAYVNPFVAVLLGWLFRDEQLTVLALVAGAIIILAVAVIVSRSRPARPDAEDPDLGSERLAT